MRRFTLLLLPLLVAGCNGSGSSVTTQEPAPDLAAAAPEPLVEAGAPAARAALEKPLAAVDEKRIADTISHLAGVPTRSTCSDPSPQGAGIGSARDWIRARFDEIPGLRTTLDAFSAGVCGAGAQAANVVAWLPGDPARLVVVGGHYDSRTVDLYDGTAPAPGANDSGSQTALVLEVARALAAAAAQDPFDATVVFVAFAGEEQNLLGSSAFVKHVPTLFPGGTVEAMLNSDIVGGDNTVNDAAALKQFRLFSPGTPREIKGPDGTADDTSPSRNLMRYVGASAALHVPAMTMLPQLREDRPGRGGDHEPFITAKMPAVRFIEPVEEQTHQHTGDDLVMYVTPSYTAQVTRAVAATAARLAWAPRTPKLTAVDGNAAGFTIAAALDGTARQAGARVGVLGIRPVTENFHTRRLRVPGDPARMFTAADLGVVGVAAYYVSVAAVDAAGDESRFSAPEFRCDAAGCAIPPDALNVTATK